MKNSSFKQLTNLLNYFMIMLIFLAIAILILLPVVAKWYIGLEITNFVFNNNILLYYILIILYLSGTCAIIILNELRKMFKTCSLENPFIYKNVKSLKTICIASALISLIFSTKIFILNSLLTVVVVFVFIIAALFSYILSELFEKAVYYKNENDLTI